MNYRKINQKKARNCNRCGALIITIATRKTKVDCEIQQHLGNLVVITKNNQPIPHLCYDTKINQDSKKIKR